MRLVPLDDRSVFRHTSPAQSQQPAISCTFLNLDDPQIAVHHDPVPGLDELERISIEVAFNIPLDLPTRVFVTAGGDPPVSPDTQVLTFEPANQYTIQAERFAAAILDGTPVPIPPADAVANLRVIEELFRAG